MLKIKTLVIDGKPVGKGRPRFSFQGGKPHVYTPQDTTTYEQKVRYEYRRQLGNYFIQQSQQGIKMIINAVFQCPTSKSLSDKIAPKTKPDVDNIAKIILDALNGFAYKDDAEVTSLTTIKTYGDKPEVRITFLYEGEEEND